MILLLTAAACAYQMLAVVACLMFLRSAKAGKHAHAAGHGGDVLIAPVSILKPVRGLDPAFADAIRTHSVLAGEYEFLCGVRDDDPAIALLKELPGVTLVPVRTIKPNRKVGALIDLAAAAKYPILIVNDSDIRVEPDYLQRVTAPLADQNVGLVTCLYRPIGKTFAARFEGMGVTTDFAPSTLVARLLGVNEFGMGSTLAFRRADLERIGGFASIADYLADDYQLGRHIHALGLKCVLSDVIVETNMGGNWREVWAHQLRWARTIRVTKFGGYLGLPITNATLWALIAALAGHGRMALACMATRYLMALVSGWVVMRSADFLRLFLLLPARDLFGFAVWLAALAGKTVEWRGLRLRLDSHGRIR